MKLTKADKIQQLQALQSQIIATHVASSLMRGGEEYAEIYKKNKSIFEQLVKSEIKTDRAMRKYFRELSERIIDNLNWSEFESRKASILDYLVKAFWEGETLVLKVNLSSSLVEAIEAGGLYTEEELKIDIGWSRNFAPAIEFLNKYTLELAKGLTQTTKKRVLASLKTSIDEGEDRDGAVNRITKVINDRRRATTIAQTESVRAFSSGRMEVGRQIGANRKRWRTAGDSKVSEICQSFEREGVVPFDFVYKYDNIRVNQPPAHPNCRSGIELFMPEENV